ncbi:5-formyltetrahydrofolate cyclo-ligase [Pseudochryseolinea flava]|uniref:5-formyltetrahydrofolate cyclo-ligase n=1 Tax=Pseudochryseolinea flava TaxID=2059302 RepID=A0A364Y871_9BACT|nr:5-formyltetrahydrofolate cyclo-ligase [Pseudochryseolinea flava]RAW03316.1 5-formyltetrahydrofolate cyclo-ligase [Pseudochryseolinea flava]
MTKKELRTLYIQKRKQLSDEEYRLINQGLYEQFFKFIDLSNVRVLHVFLTIEKQREPNTWPIIDRIQRDYPQIQLSIPRVNPESGTLENFYYEGLSQLKNNTWGIPEPTHGVPTPDEKIDMVLVPLLTFDENGNRVGYGKGFYDKLLASCSPQCQKIGLSMFTAVARIHDIQTHDIPLHKIITPSEIFIP